MFIGFVLLPSCTPIIIQYSYYQACDAIGAGIPSIGGEKCRTWIAGQLPDVIDKLVKDNLDPKVVTHTTFWDIGHRFNSREKHVCNIKLEAKKVLGASIEARFC